MIFNNTNIIVLMMIIMNNNCGNYAINKDNTCIYDCFTKGIKILFLTILTIVIDNDELS